MEKLDRVLRAVMYWVGVVATALILAVLAIAGYYNVVYRLNNPAVERGVATAHRYDDGHIWYSDVTFGRYTFRKTYGGHERYLIEVTDDAGHSEWWEVSQEDFYAVEDGQTVSKSQFK